MKQRASFVKWTNPEWTDFVALAALLYVNGTATSETDAFRKANNEMPADRRRIRTAGELFPSTYKEWAIRWPAALTLARAQKKEIEAIPAPEPTPEPVVAAPTSSEMISQALVQAVIDALESPRGQEALRRAFIVQGGVPSEEVVKTAVKGIVMPAPMRKKSILIVGLIGSQAIEIKSAFADKFALRFLDADDSSQRMKEHSSHVDLTMGMIGYMHHSVDGRLKKAAQNYQRVNGTVGELKRILGSMLQPA